MMRSTPIRFLTQELFETVSEVAKRIGIRRITRQVGPRKLQELAFANYRAKPGIIVVKAVEDAKPVLTIVDFKPFKGAQSIVRLNKLRSDLGHTCTICPAFLHPPLRRERPKQGTGHDALQLPQLPDRVYFTRRSQQAGRYGICWL